MIIIQYNNQYLKISKKIFKLIKKKRISNFSPINQIDLIKEGLSSMEGDIICLLDADDYFLPKKLEIIHK